MARPSNLRLLEAGRPESGERSGPFSYFLLCGQQAQRALPELMVSLGPQAPQLSGAVLVGHVFGVVTCDDFDLVESEGRGWSRWVLITRGRLGAPTVLGIRGNHVMSVAAS